MFGQNVDEHNPAPSPSGHPLLSGPPTLNDIHQIFTNSARDVCVGLDATDAPTAASLRAGSLGRSPGPYALPSIGQADSMFALL